MSRTPKDKAEIIRYKLWYWSVKSVEGLSDYALDIKFCDGLKLANRPRLFELIRKHGTKPTIRKYSTHTFNLIENVITTPCYEHTGDILSSPFWTLIKIQKPTVDDVKSIVIDCIDRMGLAKLPGNYQDDGSDDLANILAEKNIDYEEYGWHMRQGDIGYMNSMDNAFNHYEWNLDYAALVGALAIECAHARKMQMSDRHLMVFETFLTCFHFGNSFNLLPDALRNELVQIGMDRVRDAIKPKLNPNVIGYKKRLSLIPQNNPTSAVAAFLERHERLLL